MNLTRTVLLGVGGAAVAVWIAAAATTGSRPLATRTRVTTRAVDATGAELASEVARLHERLRPSATPIQSRDLFRYASAPKGVASTAPAVAAAVSPDPGPAPIPASMKLVGIAEESSADAAARTAIIAGFGDLFLVKVGDAVTLRYRVSTVGSNDVELLDASDQTTIRLTLP